jgi:hypothetical protein
MRDSATKMANRDADEIKTHAPEQEHEADTKFAGGKPPPVGGAFHEPAGTSQLAFEEDENERELKTKVGSLVAHKFGGDYQKAFEHYDHDKNGGIGKSELVQLLADAGVGNGFTRGVWASKIIEKLDGADGSSANGEIAWNEFASIFRAHA